jgi:hypothetical protein
MPDDALPQVEPPVPPPEHGDPAVEPPAADILQFPANENAPGSAPAQAPQDICSLDVGERDERGNTVKYIYSCDRDYAVYYSRLEHKSDGADTDAQADSAGWRRWARLLAFPTKRSADLPYESEGVQAQLSSDPDKRKKLRQCLLPLGTDRAKLQALLRGWPRRQSYDSSIATALQLALDGGDAPGAKENALQTLTDARTSILNEREIAGRAQYARFTLLVGIVGMFLLVFAQHNLFKDSGNFWLGTQAGLIGAVMSIAVGIRRKTVALDIGIAGNLSDSALRLMIGAVSGGTFVLLFSTGLLPPLHTLQGDMNGQKSTTFVMLLGIIAGFVEQLVPSLLEDQAQKITNGGSTKAATPPATQTPAPASR